MKEKCLLFIFFVFVHLSGFGSSSQIARVIFREDLPDEMYRKSVEDLQEYLEKVTGEVFLIKKNGPLAAPGIYVMLNKKAGPLSAAEAKKLDNGTIEDFYLIGDRSQVFIIANHPLGLSRGIYTYLDRLGLRWYFPGNIWEHIPKVRDIGFRQRIFGSPEFSLRDFFGTGGLFPVPSINMDEEVKMHWEDWKRRNRFGGSVRLGGHYWESFNLRHEKELRAHPEYLAEIKGKRVPWHVSSKFCISNKNLVKLFVSDRVTALKSQLANSRYNSEKIIIPVDPSDGGGHCECKDCIAMGSVSDRVFYLANVVAREFRKISQRAYVNLYAYNEHAAPPSGPLESNVLVQIIPYAFQNVGTPEEMISLWKAKSSQLYLYDYYGIPDWHYETPLSGRWSTDKLISKIRYWKSKGIRGVLFESSNGIGTTGLGLYLAGRMTWDMKESPEEILDGYYRTMFGGGSASMKNYYEKINSNFREIADVPYLYKLLDRVQDESAGSKIIEDRVNLFRAYVHYVALYYNYKASSDNIRDGSWEQLIEFAWKIYPTMMIHTTRIAELLGSKLGNNQNLIEKWGIYKPNASGIKATSWITDVELNGYIEKDRVSYPLLKDFPYERKSTYKFLQAISQESARSMKPAEFLVLDFPGILIRMDKSGEFRFRLKSYEGGGVDRQDLVITCIDTSSGEVVWEQSKRIAKKSASDILVRLTPGKTYQLHIRKNNWIRLSIDPTQYFEVNKIPTYSYMGKLWFYQPPGASYIYFKNTATTNPVFADAKGNVSTPVRVNKEGIFQVPVSMRGGWWSVDRTELKFLEFYNHPAVFFPHPQFKVKEFAVK